MMFFYLCYMHPSPLTVAHQSCPRCKHTPLPSGSPMHVVCSQQSRVSKVLESPSSNVFPKWLSGNVPSSSRKRIQEECYSSLSQTGKNLSCVLLLWAVPENVSTLWTSCLVWPLQTIVMHLILPHGTLTVLEFIFVSDALVFWYLLHHNIPKVKSSIRC